MPKGYEAWIQERSARPRRRQYVALQRISRSSPAQLNSAHASEASVVFTKRYYFITMMCRLKVLYLRIQRDLERPIPLRPGHGSAVKIREIRVDYCQVSAAAEGDPSGCVVLRDAMHPDPVEDDVVGWTPILQPR